MFDTPSQIVVTGDLCQNVLQWRETNSSTQKDTYHYQQYPSVKRISHPGGALFLAKLVEVATHSTVKTPSVDDSMLEYPLLLSTVEIAPFPTFSNTEPQEARYRVKSFWGYSFENAPAPKSLPVHEDTPFAKLILIDDENNGFHHQRENWPLALTDPNASPIIIYKTNQLKQDASLWQHLQAHHLAHTLLIINAEDLRALGVNISKGLSWERTGLDFVWQLKNNPTLKALSKCSHLIVPFGLEGVIYYQNLGTPVSTLYFLTDECEGSSINEDEGQMYGLTSCFVAGLAAAIYKNFEKNELLDAIDHGIRKGMIATQKYFKFGFGTHPEKDSFPEPLVFVQGKSDLLVQEYIQRVEIKTTSSRPCEGEWYIINDKSPNSLADIGYEIVKYGADYALKYIPIANFRNLKMVDRTEIEAYRSIKNLIAEYIAAPNALRPLSIAVFGTPGSGKSFGVTEIAASIAPHLIEKRDFNLSQFQDVSDLIVAFHKTRDIVLNGKLPLIFFDEFDSAFHGKLGWLKYFLAPMQDGLFREGDSTHPIGKAIFVFAGGTSNTYESFSGISLKDKTAYNSFISEFQAAKGPDFISRLRGYVNILGPNPTDEKNDQLYVIRRAMLARSLLERKVPHLIHSNGEAAVDNGIIRALLKVPRYKHESRSMEAIMEMSMLTQAKKWEQSYLPSKSQLKLHVDEEQFYHYMMLEQFFSEKVADIAIRLYEPFLAIHNLYYLSTPHIPIDGEEMDLLKKDLYKQIKKIPEFLEAIHYEILYQKKPHSAIIFSKEEIDLLAKSQHQSLLHSTRGFLSKDMTFTGLSHSSCMISWEKLPDNIKQLLKTYIALWPLVLKDVDLKIQSLSTCRN